MKEKVSRWLLVIGAFLILGIVGGIDNGEPISNLLWCIPIMLVMKGCANE